jgi:hypothetical protein
VSAVQRPASTTGAAQLYRELAQLSEETGALLHGDDDAALDATIVRRHALLARIAATAPAASEVPEISATIDRILALDRALLTQAEAHREALRRELTQMAERRVALHSYRGASPTSAVYVERLT